MVLYADHKNHIKFYYSGGYIYVDEVLKGETKNIHKIKALENDVSFEIVAKGDKVEFSYLEGVIAHPLSKSVTLNALRRFTFTGGYVGVFSEQNSGGKPKKSSVVSFEYYPY